MCYKLGHWTHVLQTRPLNPGITSKAIEPMCYKQVTEPMYYK